MPHLEIVHKEERNEEEGNFVIRKRTDYLGGSNI